MQIHELKLNKRKPRKRIGRGGKRGTYCGRGMKGQKSRSGVSIDPLFEGGRSSLIERLKKSPGFKSTHLRKNIIKLDDLDKVFKNGDSVSVESLVKAGLVDKMKAERGVKILGSGKLTKKLSVDKKILLSDSAKKVIEKTGGNMEKEKKINKAKSK